MEDKRKDARFPMLDTSAFAEASIFAKAKTDKLADKRFLKLDVIEGSRAPIELRLTTN